MAELLDHPLLSRFYGYSGLFWCRYSQSFSVGQIC